MQRIIGWLTAGCWSFVALTACSNDTQGGTVDVASDTSVAPDTSVATDTGVEPDTSVAPDATVDSAAPDMTATDSAAPDADSDGDASAAPVCPPCVTDADCNGDVCAQLGGDSYCAPRCGSGDTCAPDRACTPATTVAGDQVSLCITRSDTCTVVDDQPGPTGDTVCGSLVAPTVSAACHACSAGSPCQTNGCFGGWWCNTAGNHCLPPPTTCGGGDPLDAGPAVTGTLGNDGGTLSRLVFAIVGDTRPPSKNDDASYPTPIITAIYQHVEAFLPHPPFVVSTGDYVFAGPTTHNGSTQLDLYLGARASYTGVLYPALGNHECTGYTVSNCGPGTIDGMTQVYTDYLAKMLGPIGKTTPWYTIHLAASDHSWTAKLVFVAANAWTPEQATWLEGALSEDTTYTFIVRHEPKNADTAPGTTASEAIMARHPYTLSITGHSHTYFHGRGLREVVVGNGGAPLSSRSYGFALVHQRDDGAVQVDMLDYATTLPDPQFRFVVSADGTQL